MDGRFRLTPAWPSVWLLAKGCAQVSEDRRATFTVLTRQPKTTHEGELIAQAISTGITSGCVRNLEDGPFGGSRISLGDTHLGEIVNCPLPSEGAWQMVGVSDVSLAQTAYQLSSGRLWIEGMPVGSAPNVPVVSIGDVCDSMGPHHLNLTGAKIKSDGLPQGPFERILGAPSGAAYPCLWNHDARRERRMTVCPDSHCRVRDVAGRVPRRLRERADVRWSTATRAHYNQDLQFNSQSVIVAMTDRPSIGGRAWPSVIVEDPDQEFAFALWCNSTLGLLCHWWMSNKTQAGKGATTVTSIPLINTLDLRALSRGAA